jgi:hypothetical protein
LFYLFAADILSEPLDTCLLPVAIVILNFVGFVAAEKEAITDGQRSGFLVEGALSHRPWITQMKIRRINCFEVSLNPSLDRLPAAHINHSDTLIIFGICRE